MELPMKLIRQSLRWGYAPLMLMGMNGLGLSLITNNFSHGSLVALFLAAIVLSFIAERILPYERSWNKDHHDGPRDFWHALVNEGSNALSLTSFPFITSFLSLKGAWPQDSPFVIQVLLSIVIFDLGVTLCHYASHKTELLWRFHAVHHCSERMYGFNGLVKHPIHQFVEGGCGLLPLVLLGIPFEVTVALVFSTSIQLLLQHSNVDYRIGVLKYVLALNQAHRFHHQKWAGIGDVNFGLFTTFWDHLLGTFVFDPKKVFTSEDLGIGSDPDYPRNYIPQLLEPFKKKGSDQRAISGTNLLSAPSSGGNLDITVGSPEKATAR